MEQTGTSEPQQQETEKNVVIDMKEMKDLWKEQIYFFYGTKSNGLYSKEDLVYI